MSATTYRATDFLTAATRLGIEAVIGCDEEQTLADLAPGSSIVLDFVAIDASVEAVQEFAARYPVDAVLSVDDSATLLASAAARRLGLPHNHLRATKAAHYKHITRKRLRDAGLPSPPTVLASIHDDARAVARRAPYPCVLKPVFLSASQGIVRADTRPAFVEAFERISRLLRRDDIARRGGEAADLVLVEGYVEGDEVALEGLLADDQLHVLAVFDKPDPLVGPFFEETIYVTPSVLPGPALAALRETAARAGKALGLERGPLHLEARINPEGVWVIDVAARSIGGLCGRALRFAGGSSLEELILRHALGLPIGSPQREETASGVMMLPIPRAGVLKSVAGVEAARSLAGIDDVVISIPVGSPVEPPPEGNRYLGFVFARAERRDVVVELLRRAHGMLRFEID